MRECLSLWCRSVLALRSQVSVCAQAYLFQIQSPKFSEVLPWHHSKKDSILLTIRPCAHRQVSRLFLEGFALRQFSLLQTRLLGLNLAGACLKILLFLLGGLQSFYCVEKTLQPDPLLPK